MHIAKLLQALGPWLMMLLGAATVVFGLVDGRKTSGFIARAIRTQGTVVRYIERPTEYGPAYAPVVQYVAGGERHEYISPEASSPPRYAIGQTPEVFYDPVHPQQAKLEDSIRGARSLTAFGMIFVAGGLAALWLSSKFGPGAEAVWRFEWKVPW